MTAPRHEPAPPTTLAHDPPPSDGTRQRQLAVILAAKLEQGYKIESHSDTEAVVVIRGPKRWFGLLPHGPSTRQRISFDDQGRLQTRGLKPPAPVEAR